MTFWTSLQKKLKDPDLGLFWLAALVLLIIAALAYLPLISQINYAKDDWYLMYIGRAADPDYFRFAFQGDRPARAYVMALAYTWFGGNIFFYHLSGFLFRFLSGVSALWLAGLLWPRQRHSNFMIALFFLIYPGFLSQTNPIDYQSQLCSLFMAIFSIALTAKAVQVKAWWFKIPLYAAAIVTGWIDLALVDYFIGFEALRLLVIFIMISPNAETWYKKAFRTLINWLDSCVLT